MTSRDHDKLIRALACDWNNPESLQAAQRGLQSTEDSSLVPLHQKVTERLAELDRTRGVRPSGVASRIVDSIARTVEIGTCSQVADGFLCGSCTESCGCDRANIAALIRSSLVQQVVAAILLDLPNPSGRPER